MTAGLSGGVLVNLYIKPKLDFSLSLSLSPVSASMISTWVTGPLCPVNKHAPDSMFQILMILSSEQLTRMLGFWGSKATQRTQPLLANTKLEYPVRSIASPLAQQRPISDCLVPHRGFFNELSLEAVTFKLFLDLIRRAAKRACFDVNIDASRETSSLEGSLKLRQI